MICIVLIFIIAKYLHSYLVRFHNSEPVLHYNDVIMNAMVSQITSLTIVYSTAYLGADQRKHQSSASLAFVRGIHRRLVNSPHKGPVTRKMFPFDDVIMVIRWRTIHAPKNSFILSSVEMAPPVNTVSLLWNMWSIKQFVSHCNQLRVM